MTVNCLNCGKEFKTFPSIIKSGKGKYCGKSCSAKHNHHKLTEGRKKLLASGYKIITPKRGVYLKCLNCSQTFYREQSQKDHKLCSIKCGGEYRRGREKTYKKILSTRGEKHYNWKGGKSHIDKRGTPEYREWRKGVFERDKYTCQECGIKTGCGKRVSLHADHIKPYSLYPELAFDLSNGRTLCVDCHRNTPTYGMNKMYVKPNTPSILFADYDNSLNATIISNDM